MQHQFLVSFAGPVLVAACSSIPGQPEHQRMHTDHCTEYRATMAGKSPEEQRQAAEAHIVRMHGSSDPAHVERHTKMMEQRCVAQGQPKG